MVFHYDYALPNLSFPLQQSTCSLLVDAHFCCYIVVHAEPTIKDQAICHSAICGLEELIFLSYHIVSMLLRVCLFFTSLWGSSEIIFQWAFEFARLIFNPYAICRLTVTGDVCWDSPSLLAPYVNLTSERHWNLTFGRCYIFVENENQVDVKIRYWTDIKLQRWTVFFSPVSTLLILFFIISHHVWRRAFLIYHRFNCYIIRPTPVSGAWRSRSSTGRTLRGLNNYLSLKLFTWWRLGKWDDTWATIFHRAAAKGKQQPRPVTPWRKLISTEAISFFQSLPKTIGECWNIKWMEKCEFQPLAHAMEIQFPPTLCEKDHNQRSSDKIMITCTNYVLLYIVSLKHMYFQLYSI